MRPSTIQRFSSGADDVGRGIEIGFTDLQMDNIFALGLKRPRLYQHVKGGLGAQA